MERTKELLDNILNFFWGLFDGIINIGSQIINSTAPELPDQVMRYAGPISVIACLLVINYFTWLITKDT